MKWKRGLLPIILGLLPLGLSDLLPVPAQAATVAIDSECPQTTGVCPPYGTGDLGTCRTAGCNGLWTLSQSYAPPNAFPSSCTTVWCGASTNFFNNTVDYQVTSFSWLLQKTGSPEGTLQTFIMYAKSGSPNLAGTHQPITPNYGPDNSRGVLASSVRQDLGSIPSNATLVPFTFNSTNQPVLNARTQYEAVISIVNNSTLIDSSNTITELGTQGCNPDDATCSGVIHIGGSIESTTGAPNELQWTVRSWEIQQFSVQGVAVPPTISSISPTNGDVGTLVTVTGSSFAGTTQVTFCGVPATVFTVINDTLITAIAPSTPNLICDIVATNPAGSSATSTSDLFTYPCGRGGVGGGGGSRILNV